MTLPEIYGHEDVWARLNALLAADRLPHALLFLGAPGIGKSLVAQRLAARLACTDAAPPCGACAGCRQLLAGSHPDVLAISAPERGRRETRKKEIGIEQARALKRFVQLQAVSAARKIAIVDDADRLSIAAQNALLKTLEEPPGHAAIVLITATPGALLPTVRSRCQRIAFRPLSDDDVVAALTTAAGVSPDEARQLASDARGSPGQALEWRALWEDADRAELLARLAALQDGRYASILAMSKGLGRTEPETAARLEGLLAVCHAEAADAAARDDAAGLARAVRRADSVSEALSTLRRRNPNRPLLTEALALRLART
ncbi:MAG: DNA polymerase III subunit delta' [Candidatus Binatia bacterium]